MKKNKGLGDPDKNLNEKTNSKEGGNWEGPAPRTWRGTEEKRVLGRA